MHTACNIKDVIIILNRFDYIFDMVFTHIVFFTDYLNLESNQSDNSPSMIARTIREIYYRLFEFYQTGRRLRNY